MPTGATAIAVLLAALLAVGCERPAGERTATPPDSIADDTTPVAASPLDAALDRWAARLPDSLRHRRGACPFECCVYGSWTGTGEVPLRVAPDRARAIAFRIRAGEAFQADSGFVRITGVSVLAVEDSVDAEGARFAPGDTLVVLDYVGEGRFNVWDGERVLEVTGFWGAEAENPKATLLGGDRYAREWWVHATTRDRNRGWIDADSVPRIRGADACGG